jgi:hypothetical protein
MSLALRWLLLIPLAVGCAAIAAVFATFFIAAAAPEFGDVIGSA